MENISLYIPRVFANISRETISKVFLDQEIGSVKSVDFIPKMDSHGQYYNCAFVHFDYWFDNIIARNLQSKIRNIGELAKIVYDDPWYWVVFENKTEKRIPNKPKLRIDLSDLKPKNLLADFEATVSQRPPTPIFDTTINLVDDAYVSCLENEMRILRDENQRLRSNFKNIV